eukprot:3418092-Ditylum_brightwellii.AAC.1
MERNSLELSGPAKILRHITKKQNAKHKITLDCFARESQPRTRMILNCFSMLRFSVVTFISITMLLVVNSHTLRPANGNKKSISSNTTFTTKVIDRAQQYWNQGHGNDHKHDQRVRHFRIRDEPVADEHVDVVIMWH